MGDVDLAWQLPAREYTDPSGWLIRHFAVCIRWEERITSSGNHISAPYIYCNAAHVARGISSVRVVYTGGRLAIAPSVSWGNALESVHIQPDETFTANGLTFGPSMSTEASIQIARNGTPIRADDPLFISLSLGNIWFAATSTTPPPTPA